MLTPDTWRDVRTVAQLLRPVRRHGSHQERLEAFYRGQARHYDAFRQRLLPGRRELIESLPLRQGAIWVDLGGGTGHNLLHAGPGLRSMNHVYVVDLTPSLLAIARQRCRDQGWTNVSVVEGDATHLSLATGCADIVTCSYSLTMIPAWQGAVQEAVRLLKPGGTFGAVDFYVGPDHPIVTQRLWPWWFAHSHVYLSQEHLPYLKQRFGSTSLHEARTRLPYLPVGRVPYYRFTGTRR